MSSGELTESTGDADRQIANWRTDALKVLRAGSFPAVVAEVAADLSLSRAMNYRLLAIYRRHPFVTFLLSKRYRRSAGTRMISKEVEAVDRKELSRRAARSNPLLL